MNPNAPIALLHLQSQTPDTTLPQTYGAWRATLGTRPQLKHITARAEPALEMETNLIVLEVIAQNNQEVIASHGAVALNQFGLSTQNQLRPVFYTTGRSRKVKIGHQEVELRHVNPKRLPLGNSKAGLALTAMRYIGKKGLEPKMVLQIRQQLEPADWQQLQAVRLTQPEWLVRLLESANETNHG